MSRKSYLPSSGSIQSQETPVKTVFMWTLLARSDQTVFMRSVSDDTVLLSSPASARNGLPSTINCTAWPCLSRCGIPASTGRVCAFPAARQHRSATLARKSDRIVALISATYCSRISCKVVLRRSAAKGDAGPDRRAGAFLWWNCGLLDRHALYCRVPPIGGDCGGRWGVTGGFPNYAHHGPRRGLTARAFSSGTWLSARRLR